MKKTLRKGVSLLLTAVLLFGLLAVTAAAEEAGEEKPYEYYVSFGDSVTAGYGLEDFDQYYQERFVAGSYSNIIKGRVAKDGAQFGHIAWRLNEMLIALNAGEPDAFDIEFFPSYVGSCTITNNVHDINDKQPEYIAAVKKADLITLNFGGNDLIGNALFVISEALLDNAAESEKSDLRKVIDNALSFDNKNEALANLITSVSDAELAAKALSEVMTKLPEFVEAYQKNFDAVIEAIRTLNEDADIIVYTVLNPGSTFLGDADVSLETLFEIYLGALNLYISTGSHWRTEYGVASVAAIPLDDTPDGAHPGPMGHAFMAEQALGSIEELNKECKHDLTVRLFQTDATLFADGYTGDVVCVECGTVVEPGHSVNILGMTTEGNTFGFALLFSLIKLISDLFAKIAAIL